MKNRWYFKRACTNDGNPQAFQTEETTQKQHGKEKFLRKRAEAWLVWSAANTEVGGQAGGELGPCLRRPTELRA